MNSLPCLNRVLLSSPTQTHRENRNKNYIACYKNLYCLLAIFIVFDFRFYGVLYFVIVMYCNYVFLIAKRK